MEIPNARALLPIPHPHARETGHMPQSAADGIFSKGNLCELLLFAASAGQPSEGDSYFSAKCNVSRRMRRADLVSEIMLPGAPS
jgi:hypothetical protein